MKKIFTLLGLMTLLYTANAVTVINVEKFVKKYGVGNDHTKALNKAVEMACKSGKVLYFPPGTYFLSDTICIAGISEIYGHGYPRLVMKKAQKDILFSEWAWRIKISGICFEGGKDQLALGNPNTDKGMLQISDCRFLNASGSAIRFLRRKKAETASSFCLVEKCIFEYCLQTLIAVSDQTHFKDSWITTAKKNKKNLPVIENYGVLICSNILGVPHVANKDLRWINNYGMNLTCRNFRFGGEGGGFTPVVNYAKFQPKLFGPVIIIEDSFIGAQGNSVRKCAVFCEEIPNRIAIRDCQITGVPPVIVSKKIDIRKYFNRAVPGMISMKFSGNIGEFSADVPKHLLAAIKEIRKAKYTYGSKQLSSEATEKALTSAIALAKKYPSASIPARMKYQTKHQFGHKQQTNPNHYEDITFKTNKWLVDDYLDGVTEKCSSYLKVAPARDDIIILNRISPSSYPHVRIKKVCVDLDKTPVLAWRFKDNGVKGGHVAVKIIDNATSYTSTLMENYYDSQFQYYAYDLRKLLGRKHGKASIDIKIYLCGTRIKSATGKSNYVELQKGEYFLLDFIRLEKTDK